MGVGTVALLHATVRRVTGSGWAGIVAGAATATTPVAVLMFRFDNPDALLTLLLTGSAYALIRALQVARARCAGSCSAAPSSGWPSSPRPCQAFLVLPGLALAYALCAAVPWRRRIGHLLAAFGAMLVAGGWWVAVVEVVPASMRPYVGGSQTDSFLELTSATTASAASPATRPASVGGGAGWGNPGLLRLFGSENGGQVAWLLPVALVLGIAALVWGRRTVRGLAVVLLGWLVVTALTFSLMEGMYHAYYTVVLAPAIGGLVALGSWVLWWRRRSLVATGLLGGTVAMTTALAFALLDRAPDWQPWLRFVLAAVGFGAALLVVGVRHLPRAVASGVAVASLLAVLAGPLRDHDAGGRGPRRRAPTARRRGPNPTAARTKRSRAPSGGAVQQRKRRRPWPSPPCRPAGRWRPASGGGPPTSAGLPTVAADARRARPDDVGEIPSIRLKVEAVTAGHRAARQHARPGVPTPTTAIRARRDRSGRAASPPFSDPTHAWDSPSPHHLPPSQFSVTVRQDRTRICVAEGELEERVGLRAAHVGPRRGRRFRRRPPSQPPTIDGAAPNAASRWPIRRRHGARRTARTRRGPAAQVPW